VKIPGQFSVTFNDDAAVRPVIAAIRCKRKSGEPGIYTLRDTRAVRYRNGNVFYDYQGIRVVSL
jgi:hypothetical protein